MSYEEMKIIGLKDVEEARVVVSKYAHVTHLDYSKNFSLRSGSRIFLKKENLQKTGSFKIRGATNKMSKLSNEEKQRGVIACSAGNHAQGVAYSSSALGVKAKIVMPETAPLVKVEATREYGAEVVLHGLIYDQAAQYAKELAINSNATFIHPYEDADIIAGQGTCGLEIYEQLPDVDTVLVAIGGGGFISGIATVLKAKNPKCKIIGVQTAQVPSMAISFRDKKCPVEVDAQPTIADGIAVKRPSRIMYDSYVSKLVDDVVTVTEDEIAEAIVLLLERAKTVVEGAGAVSLAAALNNKTKLGKNTCVVLSGGNIDMNIVEKVIDRGLSRHGRLVRLSVIVKDIPGALHRITDCLAQERANILQVNHDRIHAGVGLMETRIDFTLETNSLKHVEQIKRKLQELGVRTLE